MNIIKYTMFFVLLAFVIMPFVYGENKTDDTCNSHTSEQQLLNQIDLDK